MKTDHCSTQELYNGTASSWVRGEPSSLSDFTARPAVLELCEPIAGLQILDLGCGEGYCSRELRRRGAGEVVGVDLSQGMIAAAQAQEEREPLGINYEVGCATDLTRFGDRQFDQVVAVFLFNYLTLAQTQECMTEVIRILRPGGRFIFSVPHPAFPYMRQAEYPFYFQVEEGGYFSQRDQQFPGRIWKRDGSSLAVQLVHKTLEDYFTALQTAGFKTMPTLRELKVLPEHVALDPSFFEPLVDYPLHLALEVSK
ncbi:SAM-dependent methyltransferase [Leptolyngbya sp. 'hensonii']|uniref:class I SAM-dependent methyltransferase n=1 Tax=Leptolyngbya sp. 'hensonii' TaxID=1922337 RepID=UPI00094FFF6F|nr:class I SAM-dependent methyltransferase [Leptolyngbya sp. 'hensonii']OLP16554.1 SAM-dependent methyltransferase [Leptolyngbya sp. 'hensonii']